MAIFIRATAVITAVFALAGGSLAAQEEKPVPKDSVRVTVPGCTKGAVFTAGPRTEDQPGRAGVPAGTRLRMNGPKKMMTEIKEHEGQMLQITGLMKRGQYLQQGIPIGGGIRVIPASPGSVRSGPVMDSTQYIDIESWQPAPGDCPQ